MANTLWQVLYFIFSAIMRICSAQFMKSYPSLRTLEKDNVAEFAFIGRSNVGKSSLINFLMHRKSLARKSAIPGSTRLFNAYRITYISSPSSQEKTCNLIDMPGYGYAKQRLTMDLDAQINYYFSHRTHICACFLLVDIRREPDTLTLSRIRKAMRCGVLCAVVCTKVDTLSAQDLRKKTSQWQKICAETFSVPYFMVSARKKKGREPLLAYMSERLSEYALR